MQLQQEKEISNAQKWDRSVKNIEKSYSENGLEYKAVCGEILVDSPSKEKSKEQSGKIFYTSYTSKKETSNVVFCFNGGPGSSSVWLNFGAFGPQRVSNLDVDEESDSCLINNAETLLNSGNLVFVDPMGTGFSSCEEEEFKHFCTEKADASYLSQFIVNYLTQNSLWGKKIFICGESYGGYRTALISEVLIKKYSVHPAGLILIAPFISGVSIEETNPNVIGEAHFLIGYIMTAWYHKKSSLNSECDDEKTAYQKACAFAYGQFLPARMKNPLARLNSSLLDELSALIGISKDLISKSNLDVFQFSHHLFQGEKRFVGRIDSRYTLPHPLVATSDEYTDPSLMTMSRKIVSNAQAFFCNQMGWKDKKIYAAFSDEVSRYWKYEDYFLASAFRALQNSLKLSPKLKVHVAAGYYDLAVPAATVEFDLNQIAETEDIQNRITCELYPSGHMMYVQETSLQKLSKSIRDFVDRI